jgi:hypothetical protein
MNSALPLRLAGRSIALSNWGGKSGQHRVPYHLTGGGASGNNCATDSAAENYTAMRPCMGAR